MEFQESSSQG
ncbi:unnamed protein product [Linum tenue]|uniref:Uncharacterized protein n=1 Tax=Linum tenue TaxID=586396 RepID=A0AAV0M548_9ROSI|nr:unnamed protein product [Linum tenue]